MSDALLCAQELYPGSTILSATLAPEWEDELCDKTATSTDA